MPRGGARPGAGRKPKAHKYARPINRAEKKIVDKLPDLVDKLIALAEEGDRDALVYLLNRIMGKPTERVEAENTGQMTIRVEYADSDVDPAAASSGPAAGGA